MKPKGSSRESSLRRVGSLIPLGLLILIPVSCFAAAPGVNLRWDQCYVDGGVSNKTFACNTNSGGEQLVGSFEVAAPLDLVVTVDVTIDVRSASAAMPAWWRMRELGTCRQTALGFSPDAFPPTTTCPDWTPQFTSSSISQFRVDDLDPSRARLNATVALRSIDAAHLDPGHEYFLFRLLLSHEKTVGTGACAGCDVPVCLFLTRVSLQRQGFSVPAVVLDRGANGADSQYATWQDGPTGPHPVCAPGSPVASRRSTWGAVKSLYR